MALFITGLFFGMNIHLSHIVSEWPIRAKEISLVNRPRRFLDNYRVDVRAWYRPVAVQIVSAFAGQQLRLIVDCTTVGTAHRLMTISVAYRKRTLPLVWSVHAGRKGHGATSAQIALFEEVAP